MELIVAPIAELRQQITHFFEEVVGETLDRGGGLANHPHAFSCGLTGGSTALIFLGALRDADVDWSRVTLYWGDERAVPPDHPDSNYGVVERLLLTPLGGRAPQAIRMKGELADVDAAALAYEAALQERLGGVTQAPGIGRQAAGTDDQRAGALDLMILGVGEDGHVCSLFPGHRALMVDDRWVVGVEDSPKPPPDRITVTLSFLLRTRHVWIVAVGPRKLSVLERAISCDAPSTPLDLVVRRAQSVTLFTDQALSRRQPIRNQESNRPRESGIRNR